MNCLSLICFYRDASRNVVTAARECVEFSDEAGTLCLSAKEKGESVVSLSREIQSDLQSFGSINASVFVKIKDLLENKKTTAAVEFAEQIGGLAAQILQKAEGMSESLKRGIDSLPDNVKAEHEAAEATNTPSMNGARGVDDGTANNSNNNELEIMKLLDVDQDIAELENSCSKSRGGELTIFSAATMGRAIFEQTTSKGELCKNLLDQLRELCTSVTTLAKSLIVDDCCAQTMAVVSGVPALFRCRSLVYLLAKGAQAAMRLIKAIGDLISEAWQRFLGFLNEFQAAKTLGKFITDVKNTKVGEMASSLVSSFIPGMSGSGKSRS